MKNTIVNFSAEFLKHEESLVSQVSIVKTSI